MSVPPILRTLGLQHLLLAALQSGPKEVPELARATGIANDHAGQQQIQRRLDALRRSGMVQQAGRRGSGIIWALPGTTILAANRKERPHVTIRRVPPATPRTSWWLVPPQQFGEVAHQRAQSKGWQDLDEQEDQAN